MEDQVFEAGLPHRGAKIRAQKNYPPDEPI